MFYNFKIIGRAAMYSKNCIRRYASFNEYWKIPWKRKNFGRYSIVQPGLIQKEPCFPQHIAVPSYYETTIPDPSPAEPEIKTSEQIEKMRKSCMLARQILECVKNYVQDCEQLQKDVSNVVWWTADDSVIVNWEEKSDCKFLQDNNEQSTSPPVGADIVGKLTEPNTSTEAAHHTCVNDCLEYTELAQLDSLPFDQSKVNETAYGVENEQGVENVTFHYDNSIDRRDTFLTNEESKVEAENEHVGSNHADSSDNDDLDKNPDCEIHGEETEYNPSEEEDSDGDVPFNYMIVHSCQVAGSSNNEGELDSVGRTTEELNELVWKLCIENNSYPSPLNYRGFPKSVCTSVNNVACHGIPDNRPLQDGDIINIDVTVYLNGYHGDCSETFLVGDVDSEGCRLVETTQLCLNNALANCRPGVEFSSIGDVVEETARQNGFTVVPAFTGHGIGSYFHGPPDIYHCYNDYPGKMATGMTFTIEPVLAQGSREIVILEDGWTAVTLDNGRTAQFEHTVLITENGVEVLTL